MFCNSLTDEGLTKDFYRFGCEISFPKNVCCAKSCEVCIQKEMSVFERHVSEQKKKKMKK